MSRKILAEVIDQCNIASNTIKVTGAADHAIIETFDKDRCLFIKGILAEPLADINGVFGIDAKDLKLLKGLLSFTSYETDGGSTKVLSRKMNGEDVLDRIEFRGAGSKSVLNLMNIAHIPQMAEIDSDQIPWDIKMELSSSKAAEVTKFASLFTDVSPDCTISTEDGNLIVTFGIAHSSVNSGSLTIAEGVDSLPGEIKVPIDKLIALIKLSLNGKSHQLCFSSGASLVGAEVETSNGVYYYYLREKVVAD